MTDVGKGSPEATPWVKFKAAGGYGEEPLFRLLTYSQSHQHRRVSDGDGSIHSSYLMNGHTKAGMIVGGTSVVDIGGVAGCRHSYEEDSE